MLELNYSKNKVLQVSVQVGSHTFMQYNKSIKWC